MEEIIFFRVFTADWYEFTEVIDLDSVRIELREISWNLGGMLK